MVAHACNPYTQEAEAGELPEPRRRWAEIAPLHSSLGNKSETPSQKKKRKKNQLGMVVGTFNPSYLRGWARRISRTWQAEVAVSRDHAIALQAGKEQDSVQKIKINIKKESKILSQKQNKTKI